MDRALRPVNYELYIESSKFTQTIEVHAYPRKETIVEIAGYNYIVRQEKQNLNVYTRQLFKQNIAGETVLLTPLLKRNNYRKLKEAIRKDTSGKYKWIETPNALAPSFEEEEEENNKKDLLKLKLKHFVAPAMAIATIVTSILIFNWGWLVAVIISTIWSCDLWYTLLKSWKE